MRTFYRSSSTTAVVVSLFVCLSILALRHSGGLETLELSAYDWCIRLQPKVPGPNTRIALIAITESDIRHQGRWPLPDATLAQALERLVQYQPRVIGLDLYRDLPIPPGSEQLEAVLRDQSQIIAAMKFGDDTAIGIAPPAVLAQTERVGFNDILVDPGGIVRRGLLFLDDGQHVAYAFALRLALFYLQAEGIIPQADPLHPQYMRLGATTIRPLETHDGIYVDADTRGYQFLLDFRDGPKTFPSYSLTALLAGEIAAEALKDKIVLFGISAASESVKDLFYTPYSRGLRTEQQMSGINLHAHSISQLLRAGLAGDAPLGSPSEGQEALWVLLWSLLGGALGLWVRSSWRFALVAAGGLLLLSVIVYIAFAQHWVIPWVPPAMAWIIAATLVTASRSQQEKAQRALLMHLFSRHVSCEVAETIWQHRDQFLHGGRPRPQKLVATVMFTDLEGFTVVAGKLPPHTLIEWLNGYMETITELVIAHGGIVDDYTGDGLKADFGVPLARTSEAEIRQDAVHAVRCALAIERELRCLNQRYVEQQLPTARMRIGICTGPVVAGSLGSAQRSKFTTLGDPVNIAARLESAAKELVIPGFTTSPCCILVSEATTQYLEKVFRTRRVGTINLKGIEQKVTVYRVIPGEEDI
jgi:adenylate cyclase